MRNDSVIVTIIACATTVGAHASIATFDSLPEGDLGATFVHSGIRFFDLDDRAGGFPVSFAVERADGTLSSSGFSAPNALGFGGWAPGPAAAFSQCGSFSFTTDSVQTFASVDVFEWLSPPGNMIWLEAYRNGVLVNSSGAVIPDNRLINHWTLTVADVPFDTLRINGTGTSDRGIFIGLVDNVVVVPTPFALPALAAALCTFRRRRS